jgi:RimJ/RimL family protein N-acetyltransferase
LTAEQHEVFLETARTRLRLWRVDEADRFLDTYSRREVSRWLGATPTLLRSREEAVTRIERWAGRAAEHPGRGLWAVERKDSGVVAGTVLLVPVPDGDGAIEVGWHLHPDSWGHGFATESAHAVLDRAFADGLDEAIAVVRPGNSASIAVCTRLGMEPRGLTDRYYGTELELFRLMSPMDTGGPGTTD